MDFNPLWLSIKITFWATLIAVIIGLITASNVYNFSGKLRKVIDSLLTIPLLLPPTTIGLIIFWLIRQQGPISGLLQKFKIPQISDFSGAVIASTIVAFPWMYRTALQGFVQVDQEIIQVAKTLGVSKSKILWQLVLPLSSKDILIGIILTFTRALGEFGATLLLVEKLPGKIETLPMSIYFLSQKSDINQALYWVLLTVLIALGCVFLINTVSGLSLVNSWSSLIGHWLLHSSGNQKELYVPQTTGLSVEISKSLPKFNLEIAFNSDYKRIGLFGLQDSGKSQILRVIAGLEENVQGRILLNGKVLLNSKTKVNLSAQKRRIALVFEKYALFPHLTVAQNIAFGLQHLTREARAEVIRMSLEGFKLEGTKKLYPHQLSNSQQQRLALARAVANEPEALLLDEPLASLDSYWHGQLQQLLAELLKEYRGIVIVSSYRLETLYPLCPSLLVIAEGLLLNQGNTEKFFEQPLSYSVAKLTGCQNISRYQYIDNQTLTALDWNCILNIKEKPSEAFGYIGIRSNQIVFVRNPPPASLRSNFFPSWLLAERESPQEITLYLKLNEFPIDPKDYGIEVSIERHQWEKLQNQPQPWLVYFAPQYLVLLKSL